MTIDSSHLVDSISCTNHRLSGLFAEREKDSEVPGMSRLLHVTCFRPSVLSFVVVIFVPPHSLTTAVRVCGVRCVVCGV